MLSHDLQTLCGSAPCCTAKQFISSKPATPTPNLCRGFRTVQTKAETTSYGRSTATQQEGSGSSALACFALSGGYHIHHIVFNVLPTKTLISVLAEKRHAIKIAQVSAWCFGEQPVVRWGLWPVFEYAGRKSLLAINHILGSQKSREGKRLYHSCMLFNPGQLVGVLVPSRDSCKPSTQGMFPS